MIWSMLYGDMIWSLNRASHCEVINIRVGHCTRVGYWGFIIYPFSFSILYGACQMMKRCNFPHLGKVTVGGLALNTEATALLPSISLSRKPILGLLPPASSTKSTLRASMTTITSRLTRGLMVPPLELPSSYMKEEFQFQPRFLLAISR